MQIIINIIEICFEIALMLNGIIVIPQIIEIIKTKNAENLSFFTFFGFWILQVTMLLHGYFHNDIKLAWGMILSLVTTGTLTTLIAIYGNGLFSKRKINRA